MPGRRGLSPVLDDLNSHQIHFPTMLPQLAVLVLVTLPQLGWAQWATSQELVSQQDDTAGEANEYEQVGNLGEPSVLPLGEVLVIEEADIRVTLDRVVYEHDDYHEGTSVYLTVEGPAGTGTVVGGVPGQATGQGCLIDLFAEDGDTVQLAVQLLQLGVPFAVKPGVSVVVSEVLLSANFHEGRGGSSGLVWVTLRTITDSEEFITSVPAPDEDTQPSIVELGGYRVQVFVSDESRVRLAVEVAEQNP